MTYLNRRAEQGVLPRLRSRMSPRVRVVMSGSAVVALSLTGSPAAGQEPEREAFPGTYQGGILFGGAEATGTTRLGNLTGIRFGQARGSTRLDVLATTVRVSTSGCSGMPSMPGCDPGRRFWEVLGGVSRHLVPNPDSPSVGIRFGAARHPTAGGQTKGAWVLGPHASAGLSLTARTAARLEAGAQLHVLSRSESYPGGMAYIFIGLEGRW